MPRKSNGEGSIRQKGDRFEARLMMPDGHRVSVYAPTKKEAVTKLRKLQEAREQGISLGTGDETVAHYLTEWHRIASRKREFAETTAEHYDTRIRWATPYIGTHKLSQLRPAHIDGLYATLLDDGLSATSVRAVHQTLKHAFNQAVAREQILRNPFALVRPPQADTKEMQVFTNDELRRLWDESRDSTWYPLWVLLGTTGIRIGEALALRWHHIRPTTIVIAKTMQSVPGRRGPGKVKTRDSERVLSLTPFCIRALEAHRAAQPARTIDKERDYVFSKTPGAPYRRETVQNAFDRDGARAHVPRLTLHGFRHTYATLLLEQGIPLHKVARILGHANPTITARVYAHVTEKMEQDALDATEAIIAGTAQKRG